MAVSYVSITESSLHLIDVATGVKRGITPSTGEKASYGGGRLADGRSSGITVLRGGGRTRLWRIDPPRAACDTWFDERTWGCGGF